MQKINVFLISATIFVLAATSFASLVSAAQITAINESKGRIHINGSVDEGFIPGATVCFFISSGEKVFCGTIQSTSGIRAVVKVSKKEAKKMRKGLEAVLIVKKDEQEETKEVEFAAQVTRVDSNGIHIDGGTDAGFILGASVCFSVSSDEELVCGTVQDAKVSKAVVNVSKGVAEKIKIGMEAMLNSEKEDKKEGKGKEDWFR
jgi:ribosomal protein L35AE/L33A